MKYPGGKNGEGTYQWIINHMPPHETYIEGFVGSGAIMKLKKPAHTSIVIDRDSRMLEPFRHSAGILAIWSDAISWLRTGGGGDDAQTLIYLDPPYLMSTRRSKEKLYKHELTDEQHVELLHTIKSLKCMVMISGYMSELYATELRGWRTDSLRVITRGGKPAIEYLWLNFPPPIELHDYRYLGANFRAREKIKRQKQRWVARLQRMPELQRWAMFEAIDTVRR